MALASHDNVPATIVQALGHLSTNRCRLEGSLAVLSEVVRLRRGLTAGQREDAIGFDRRHAFLNLQHALDDHVGRADDRRLLLAE